jgi:arylsulfatase A-like enzyme
MNAWIRTLFGLIVLTLISLSCSGPDPDNIKPKRVLLIVIDSLRADHMGYASEETSLTPWMDSISEESVSFTRAFSPNNATIESVAAIFGGIPYSQLPGHPRVKGLPEETITLAEHLHEQGFHTRAWVANFNLRFSRGYGQGFDSFHYVLPDAKPDGDIDDIIRNIEINPVNRSENEFIYVHLQDVHHPYQPDYPWSQLKIIPYVRDVVLYGNMYTDFDKLVEGTGPYYDEHQDVQQIDKDYLYQLYKNEIRNLDARLNELLVALEYDPDEDMLILTADHGEQFFEQDFWRHSFSMIAPELNVPLIVRSPGLRPREITQPVSLTNLYSTIVDFYDLEEPNQSTGTSFLPLLLGDDMAEEPVYCESIYDKRFGAAIIHEDWLYWLSTSGYDSNPSEKWPYREYLFDLNTDILCQNDVSESKPKITERYNKLLLESGERWQEFNSEAIAVSDVDARMGKNIFFSNPKPNNKKTVTSKSDVPPNSYQMTSFAENMHYQGSISEAPLPHYFQFSYTLSAGNYVLNLYNPETGTKYHEYLLRKPSTDWKTLQLVVAEPENGPVVLQITPIANGTIKWQPPTLRSIEVPDLNMVGHHEWDIGKWKNEFSAEDKARLETLGYL